MPKWILPDKSEFFSLEFDELKALADKSPWIKTNIEVAETRSAELFLAKTGHAVVTNLRIEESVWILSFRGWTEPEDNCTTLIIAWPPESMARELAESEFLRIQGKNCLKVRVR